MITGGQRGDRPQFTTVLDGIRVPRLYGGQARTRPDRVLGDKAYSSKANRAYLRRRGIKATIPEKSARQKTRAGKGSTGGRPPTFDAEAYTQRNTVERAFHKLKTFRAVAMRTDKREFVFPGTIDIASITIWLRDPIKQDPPDTP